MKRLFPFFLTTILLAGCASSSPVVPVDQRVIEKVFEVQKPKAELYVLCMDWVVKSFKSAKAVIQYQDKEAGKIVGKGIMVVKYGMGIPMDTHFTLTIEVKDNKIRASVEDAFILVSVSGNSSESRLDSDFAINKCLRPAVDNLYASLYAMLTAKSSEW